MLFAAGGTELRARDSIVRINVLGKFISTKT